ncbi:MAG: hypothetical protein J6K62_05585, partial [Clostridia bacterium]|nr:hypothetical protein [Clostridia bacterium]
MNDEKRQQPFFCWFLGIFSRVRELLVALMDLVILSGCSAVLYLLVRLGDRDAKFFWSNVTNEGNMLLFQFALLIFCIFFFLVVFRVYSSLWKYASSREYLLIFASGAAGYLLY